MIVITTPTGNIGTAVLEDALHAGADVRVIARDPCTIPQKQRDRIDVIKGSQDDLSTVQKAFQGADTVFWLAPPNAKAPSLEAAYTDFSRPACQAIKDQGVKRVVIVSALGRGTPMEKNAGLVSASIGMEDLIAETGVSYRALTMPSFMDNLLQQIEPIKTQGVFFSPISGDRKVPTCAIKDIASVASRLLLDTTWRGGEDVPVLGPEDLSPNDEAAILTEVLGKLVRYQQIPLDAFKDRLLQRGVSPAFAQAYVDTSRAKDQGLDNAVQRTPENSTPTSFRQWATEVLKPALLI